MSMARETGLKGPRVVQRRCSQRDGVQQSGARGRLEPGVSCTAKLVECWTSSAQLNKYKRAVEEIGGASNLDLGKLDAGFATKRERTKMQRMILLGKCRHDDPVVL